MQRRLGSSHSHQGEEDSGIAAAAFRQQQQRAQIQLQQQLQQLLAASGSVPGSGSSFNNSSLLSSSQQQQAAALALVSDMRAAALEAQLRQAVQLQQLNNHQQIVLGQQQQQDHLLLARALAGKNHSQFGFNLINPEHQQQIFSQNRQQQQQQQHPSNLQELELRLLQEQKLIDRQKQQQQQRANLLATVASEVPQDGQTNGSGEITAEDLKNNTVTKPNVTLTSGLDRKQLHMKNIVGEDVKTSVPRPSSTICETVQENKINVPPGAILVPCRARGMPMDHNFKVSWLSFISIEIFATFMTNFYSCMFPWLRRHIL